MPRTVTMPTSRTQRRTPAAAANPRRPVVPVAAVLLALIALGVASIKIQGAPPIAQVAAAVLGVAVAALVVALRIRGNSRRELVETLRRALVPLIGDIPARVVPSRWAGTFEVGYPRVLRIDYQPGAQDDAPDWRMSITETVERRLQVKAAIGSINPRKCRLILTLEPHQEEKEEAEVVQRARLVVHELFGAGAGVSIDLDEQQALRRVTVTHDMRARVAMASKRVRIERIYSAMLPDRWRANWDLTGDKVTFERRPVLPKLIPHTPELLDSSNLYSIPIAVDEDSNPVRWNLKGSGPHWMVVGRTGTGKTVAINGGVMEFCRRGWPVWILDPKRIEFMGMRAWPNVQLVATTVIDQIVTIKAAHDLMEERYARIEAGADESEFEPLGLVLDEFRNFHRAVTAWYASVKVRGMPSKCPVFEWIAAIAEKGRSAGVHIILGTQRPDADFMTGSMRDNFDTRTSLGPLSQQGAQMMWDSPFHGVAVPRKIRGRGTAINEDEVVSEVQIPWTPDPRRAFRDEKETDLQVLRALRPQERTHPPLEVRLGSAADEDGAQASEWERVLTASLRTASESGARTNASSVPSASTREAVEAPPEESDPAVEPLAGLDEDYESEAPERAQRIEPGDLVLVDEDLDQWAVADAVEEDLLDPEQLVIEWRALDDEDNGSLSVSPSQQLSVRRPLIEERSDS